MYRLDEVLAVYCFVATNDTIAPLELYISRWQRLSSLFFKESRVSNGGVNQPFFDRTYFTSASDILDSPRI